MEPYDHCPDGTVARPVGVGIGGVEIEVRVSVSHVSQSEPNKLCRTATPLRFGVENDR